MSLKFEDFQDLDFTGFGDRTPTPPEEEDFHSIYIAGETRKNHIGVEEISGKIQVRGVEYNLTEAYMIITHIKECLVKEGKNSITGKMSLECFSYKDGAPPWFGKNKRQCGTTKAERSTNDFCVNCKTHLIVAGVYCDKNGTPKLTETEDGKKKPIFGFLRGKGTKYGPIADYLIELAKKDLEPVFKPATDQSKMFEKKNVNHKRFVTKLTIGTVSTDYGNKKVFKLEAIKELSEKNVHDTLNISKMSLKMFNDKFDWSKLGSQQASSGMSGGMLAADEGLGNTSQQTSQSSESSGGGGDSGLDDIFSGLKL